MDPLAEQQYANMPSKLMGAMKEDKKPFTYTMGGIGEKGYLDLSQIKSSKMKRRIEANLKDDQETTTYQIERQQDQPTSINLTNGNHVEERGNVWNSNGSQEKPSQPMASSQPSQFIPPPPPPPPPSTSMRSFTPVKQPSISRTNNTGVQTGAKPVFESQMPQCHTPMFNNYNDEYVPSTGKVVNIPITFENKTFPAPSQPSRSMTVHQEPTSSSLTSYFDSLTREMDEIFKPFSQGYASMAPKPSTGHSLDYNNNSKNVFNVPITRNDIPATTASPYMATSPASYVTTSAPAPYSSEWTRHSNDMYHPSQQNSMAPRRYDPGSLQEQEREIYEDEKQKEQIAIKTTPYRSQAVVSPKPKTRHDQVFGSYLQMQHYPDAPTSFAPQRPVRPPSPANLTNNQRFQSYVQQVDPHAAELGVKMPYNSPIGLYSRENALDTLQKTSGNQISQPIRLVPDQSLVDGSDFARNLATSPTYRMVQELEKGRDHEPVRERVHSPVVDYGSDQYYDAGRPESPRQSASFKHLMHSLVVHQGAMV